MMSLGFVLHIQKQTGSYALAGLALGFETVGVAVSGPLLGYWMTHFGDPGFRYMTAMADVWGRMALRLANATEFGLAACVVSGNRERAEAFCKFLVAGTIWVNCFFVRDLSAPFGGSKKSGIGREGGLWSFDFYADVKNTVYAPTGWKE